MHVLIDFGSGPFIPVELQKFADDLSQAMVADILESFSVEEIRQLIEKMDVKLQTCH
jgi:hypothetical protein